MARVRIVKRDLPSPQHRRASGSPAGAAARPRRPTLLPDQLFGAEHLLRMVVLLPGHLQAAPLEPADRTLVYTRLNDLLSFLQAPQGGPRERGGGKDLKRNDPGLGRWQVGPGVPRSDHRERGA